MAAHQVKVTEVRTITEKLRILVMTGPNDEKIAKPNDEARFWADSAFADLLKPGDVVSIEVEKKDGHKDPEKKEIWLKSVNGVGANKPKGGGSGRAYTPKSAVEIHAPNIAAIIAAACDQSDESIKGLLKIYRDECANYQTATNGRQGAS